VSAETRRAIARAGELAPGTMIGVDVDGRRIAVYNVEGTYYATDDICTHRRARLSDGYLEGRTVQCPLHFGMFDVVTGHPLNPPCKIPVQTYRVTHDGDELFVEIPANA
jgi:nitrite reductase/ring-hydroxylating ferredoxin subunit